MNPIQEDKNGNDDMDISEENILLGETGEFEEQMQIDQTQPNDADREKRSIKTQNDRKEQKLEIKAKCGGILKLGDVNKNNIDIRFARRLARSIIQINKRGEKSDQAQKDKAQSNITLEQKFECTEHLLKALMSTMKSQVASKIEINQKDDGAVIISQMTRRRMFKDPRIRTTMNRTEQNNQDVRLEILLEATKRQRRQRAKNDEKSRE